MAIVIPAGPEGGLVPMTAMISAALAAPGALPGSRGDVTGADIRVADGYRVYNGTATALLERKFLASAEPTAWLYLVTVGEMPLWVGELAWENNALSPVTLYPQPQADALVAAMARAEAEASKDEYQLRILRAPNLYLSAIWLHGKKDLVLPFDPIPSPLRGKWVYTERELTKALYPLAKQRTETSDATIV